MRAPAPRLRIQPPSSPSSSCAAVGAADTASKAAAAIPARRKRMRWSMEPPNDLPEGSLRFRHEKVNIHLTFILGRLVAARTGQSEPPQRNVWFVPAVVSQS